MAAGAGSDPVPASGVFPTPGGAADRETVSGTVFGRGQFFLILQGTEMPQAFE